MSAPAVESPRRGLELSTSAQGHAVLRTPVGLSRALAGMLVFLAISYGAAAWAQAGAHGASDPRVIVRIFGGVIVLIAGVWLALQQDAWEFGPGWVERRESFGTRVREVRIEPVRVALEVRRTWSGPNYHVVIEDPSGASRETLYRVRNRRGPAEALAQWVATQCGAEWCDRTHPAPQAPPLQRTGS